MRALAVTLAIVLSTALVGAQQHRPAPPPPKAPVTSPPPFKPSGPPTVFPFPPLPTQPTGGLTGGFMSPPQVHPAYSPRRPFPGYGYGGYAGGYFYAPDAQPPGVPAAAPAEPAGMLRLSGTPSAAQVSVDGYYVGTIEDIESQRVLTLPAGPHRIELRAAGYTTSTFDVRITANETVTYRAALDAVHSQPIARPSAPAAGPAKMYLIPNCYLGNVPPKAERLPKGCDIKRVHVVS